MTARHHDSESDKSHVTSKSGGSWSDFGDSYEDSEVSCDVPYEREKNVFFSPPDGLP